MKNNTIKTTVLAVGICLFMSYSSFGQDKNRGERKGPPTFAELIKKMDANEDGKLSKKEIKGPLKENFATIDTNEDGFITKEEFEKAPRPKRKERKRN